MSTYGILLPCDGTEPLPVSVGDHTHISEMVGGLIDAVRYEYTQEAIELLEAPEDALEFTAVGYINDTGLIDGLKINTMASIVFGRELHGNVVVVSGTSPNGEYDGENHDVPGWFSDAVFNGGLHGLAQLLDAQARVEAEAVRIAYRDGVFTEEQFLFLTQAMLSDDPRHQQHVENAITVALVYATGLASGTIEKFDREAYEKWESDNFTITDEEINKFWDSQEGGA